MARLPDRELLALLFEALPADFFPPAGAFSPPLPLAGREARPAAIAPAVELLPAGGLPSGVFAWEVSAGGSLAGFPARALPDAGVPAGAPGAGAFFAGALLVPPSWSTRSIALDTSGIGAMPSTGRNTLCSR